MKYGLINMKEKKAAPAVKKPVLPVAKSVFGGADSDEEGEKEDFRRRTVTASKTTPKALDQIIESDASIYDYDGSYETFQPAKSSSSASRQTEAKPEARYVTNLKVAAKLREREREKAYERLLLKEREAEEKEGEAEGMKFVTEGYKQKLLAEKKWEYEDKLNDMLEEKTDVRTLGMQGFYSSLLNKNIAMGSSVETNALSAYTAGSLRQERVFVEGEKEGDRADRGRERGSEGDSEEEKDSKNRAEREDKGRAEGRGQDYGSFKNSNSNSNSSSSGNKEHLEQTKNDNAGKESKANIESNTKEGTGVDNQPTISAVDLARQRYLARKRNISQVNSGE